MTDKTIDGLSYEQARDELAAIVQSLETGSVELEESLKLWERGEKLAAHCHKLLSGARDRIKAARTDATDSDEDVDK